MQQQNPSGKESYSSGQVILTHARYLIVLFLLHLSLATVATVLVLAPLTLSRFEGTVRRSFPLVLKSPASLPRAAPPASQQISPSHFHSRSLRIGSSCPHACPEWNGVVRLSAAALSDWDQAMWIGAARRQLAAAALQTLTYFTHVRPLYDGGIASSAAIHCLATFERFHPATTQARCYPSSATMAVACPSSSVPESRCLWLWHASSRKVGLRPLCTWATLAT
jgi:hypothetical protein